jgi:ATP/ADP translocase
MRRERLARAYGLIGAGAILGGVAGAGAARALSIVFMPRTLMWIGCAVLASSALAMLAAQTCFAAHKIVTPTRTRDVAAGGVLRFLGNRYALLLLAVAMVASLAGIFVEFQFYLAAATSGNTGQQNAQFFANFYLLLNGGALLVQLYLMPRLQRVLGVGGSLLIMPVAILGGAAMMIGNTSLLVRSGLKLTEGGLKASIHRSNWEQAFLPVSSEQRAAAKLIIDGAAARVAEGIAAGVLYAWLVSVVGDGALEGRSTAWLTYAIIVTALCWVGLTWALRRGVARHDAVADFRSDIPLPDT